MGGTGGLNRSPYTERALEQKELRVLPKSVIIACSVILKLLASEKESLFVLRDACLSQERLFHFLNRTVVIDLERKLFATQRRD